MRAAITVTRTMTMTIMAAAIMDTDHMRRHMDMERIRMGHMRVPTASAGDVIRQHSSFSPH